MSTPDDEIQLTDDLVKGDTTAFHALYDRYHHAVYANISRYVRRPEIAEDILQEVFFALWSHRHIFTKGQSAGGWLFTVSHNKSLLYLRTALSEKKFLAALSTLPGAGEPVDEQAFSIQIDVLQEALQRLPPTKKEVFQLCKLEGKSYKEVANLLNTSPAVIKERLRSASKLIREYISSQHPALPLSALVLLLSRC